MEANREINETSGSLEGHDILEDLNEVIWDADGPASLVFSTREHEEEFLQNWLYPYLKKHPWNIQTTIFTPDGDPGIIYSLQEAVAATFMGDDKWVLDSEDPSEWTDFVFKVQKEKLTGDDDHPLGWSGSYIFIVERFDQIFECSIEDQAKFAMLISNLACDPGVTVLVSTNESQVSKFSELPGFSHLSGGGREIQLAPWAWSPPELFKEKAIALPPVIDRPVEYVNQNSEPKLNELIWNCIVGLLFFIGLTSLVGNLYLSDMYQSMSGERDFSFINVMHTGFTVSPQWPFSKEQQISSYTSPRAIEPVLLLVGSFVVFLAALISAFRRLVSMLCNSEMDRTFSKKAMLDSSFQSLPH